MTYADIHKSTCLQGSEDGPSPSDSLDGQTAEKSGPALVPVSRFRALDSEKVIPINDISGPLFSASSPSADLQFALESRLQDLLGLNGSPEFDLTWKPQAMPAGLSISRLRASARRTSDKGSGGWPTPDAIGFATSNPETAPDGGRSLATAKRKGRTWYAKSGRKEQLGLEWTARLAGQEEQPEEEREEMAGWPTPRESTGGSNPTNPNGKNLATIAGWTTPTERDHKDGGSTLENTPVNALLGRQALIAGEEPEGESEEEITGWPTPNAGPQNDTDSRWQERREELKKKHNNGNGFGMTTAMAATLAGWGTPRNPTNKGHGSVKRIKDSRLEDQVHPGEESSSSPVQTGSSGGSLNPAFVRWLMGYPEEWGNCAPTGTPSSRK